LVGLAVLGALGELGADTAPSSKETYAKKAPSYPGNYQKKDESSSQSMPSTQNQEPTKTGTAWWHKPVKILVVAIGWGIISAIWSALFGGKKQQDGEPTPPAMESQELVSGDTTGKPLPPSTT
jgi:hypothetical protein